MPKPYSLDLRERVGSYVEAGHSRRAAAAHFRVSPSVCDQFDDGFSPARRGCAQGARRLAAQQARPAPPVHLAPRGGEGRHQHAGVGRRTPCRQRREGRPRLVVALADPQQPELKKKAFRPANAIGPTCARRARRGRLNDNPRCVSSPIASSSSTKREPSFDRLRTKMTRARGRCERGERLRSKAPFGHWKTQTFVAGLRWGALTAPWVIDAPMDRAIFETYVRTQLVPTLQAGDIVILDNLPAHKSPAAEQAIRQQGAWLMFCRPTAPTSIRSKWPSPNSRRTCAP